jgi:hypothetical protein
MFSLVLPHVQTAQAACSFCYEDFQCASGACVYYTDLFDGIGDGDFGLCADVVAATGEVCASWCRNPTSCCCYIRYQDRF